MLKKTLGVACLTLSVGANAASVWDLDADTNERAGGDGVDGKEIWYDVGGGSTNGDFRLSAYNYDDSVIPTDYSKIWAYLDSTDPGMDGGGACQGADGTSLSCDGTPDDNVSRVDNNEMLGLQTTHEFIEVLSFWGDHRGYIPEEVLIDIDGFGTGFGFELYAVTKDLNGEAFVDLGLEATSQLFITTVDNTEWSQLYLSSVTTNGDLPPIPVPAAAWLFGSALLGLVAVKRRKA